MKLGKELGGDYCAGRPFERLSVQYTDLHLIPLFSEGASPPPSPVPGVQVLTIFMVQHLQKGIQYAWVRGRIVLRLYEVRERIWVTDSF